MKIALVANPDIPIPVVGYGGLERQVQWLAEEYCRLGHEVTIFGNVDRRPIVYGGPIMDQPWPPPDPTRRPWEGVRITSQHDILSHVTELRKFDIVHDRTKDHALRLSKDVRWMATLVHTDQRVPVERAVYVSDAVRQEYGQPEAPVIPEAVPVDDLPDAPFRSGYLNFGRIDRIKGNDLALGIVDFMGAKAKPYTVAGHVGRWGDQYFGSWVEGRCAEAGHSFFANPDNGTARNLVAGAEGLIHTHRWLESFSEVVAEALCHGTPVLATDPGAPKEWIAATGGGLVIPLKDLEEGKTARTTLEPFFDTEAWEPKRAEIRAKARALFDVKVTAQQYLAVYSKVA